MNMKIIRLGLAAALAVLPLGAAVVRAGEVQVPEGAVGGSLYGLSAQDIDGRQVTFKVYEGKVALVVNVASECGFTPQYAGLEKLYEELAPRGFVVLAFPSNEFGNQEPGSAKEIRTFCETRYHVTFPVFMKLETKGRGRSDIYRYLSFALDPPSWNFTKYLVDRHGRVLARFSPDTPPDDPVLRQWIDKALAAD